MKAMNSPWLSAIPRLRAWAIPGRGSCMYRIAAALCAALRSTIGRAVAFRRVVHHDDLERRGTEPALAGAALEQARQQVLAPEGRNDDTDQDWWLFPGALLVSWPEAMRRIFGPSYR